MTKIWFLLFFISCKKIIVPESTVDGGEAFNTSTINAPSPVTGLIYNKLQNNDVTIEWHPPIKPNGIIQGYNLTIKIIRYGGCSETSNVPKNLMTSETYLITNLNETMSKKFNHLIPYVTYEVTVIAYNSKLGAENKITFQTDEAKIPTGKFSDINFAKNIITWKNPVDCWTLTGPIGGARLFFFGVSENVKNFVSLRSTRWHSFALDNYNKHTIYGAEKYYVRIHLLHHLNGDHNETAYIDASFITDPKPPPKVKNLEIIEVDSQHHLTVLRWEKPPPPTNGEITKYCIKFSNDSSKSTCVPFDSECGLWKNLLCATVKQPEGQSEFIEVRGYNKGVGEPGEVAKVDDTRIVTAPTAPEILNVEELYKGVVLVKWQHPLKTGGPLKNFIIQYDLISTKLEKKLDLNESSSIQFPITFYKTEYNTRLNLLPSTRYRVSVQGVNSYTGTVSSAEIETVSSLAFECVPQTTIDTEKSQIYIDIPPITNNTKGSLLYIIVKAPSICKYGTMISFSLAKEIGIESNQVAWLAAAFLTTKQSNSPFTIGNNEINDGLLNCPLINGESYTIYLVVHENEKSVNPKASSLVWKSEPLQIGFAPTKV